MEGWLKSSPLILACMNGHKDTAIMLIDQYGADVTQRNSYGLAALHYACNNSYFELICELVKRGSKLDALDVNGTKAVDKIRTDTMKQRVLTYERSLRSRNGNDDDADI